jgi:hypothetical protein
MKTMKKRTTVAGPDNGDEGLYDDGLGGMNGKSRRRAFVYSFPVRRRSEGSYEAQCGRCLRFGSPVEAVSPEHAWSKMIKEGWTWYVSLVGTRHASCFGCMKASTPGALAAVGRLVPSG